MKYNIKKYALALLFVGMAININCQPLSYEIAKTVSANFMGMVQRDHGGVNSVREEYSNQVRCLYNITFTNGAWCLVAADRRVDPILAYGLTPLNEDDMPEAFLQMKDWYKEQIDSIVSQDANRTMDESPLWTQYLNPPKSNPFFGPGDSLLDETGRGKLEWGQEQNNDHTCSPSYNQDCPTAAELSCPTPTFEDCVCTHKPVGCGAVAMGQIMWYWQWPRSSQYAYYDWDNMPSKLEDTTSSWRASNVTRFLRDCGDASNMAYCCYGSWTIGSNIVSAFRNTFGYNAVKLLDAYKWSRSVWVDLIKSEVDNKRPVLFYGDNGFFPNSHYFVVDGSQEINGQTLFHVNWGHCGSGNCYCRLDRFRDPIGPTFYNRSNCAIVGISPTYMDVTITGTSYPTVAAGHAHVEYAYDKITIPATGGVLTVADSGKLYLEAGREVELRDGFVAEAGSEVEVVINPEWLNVMAIELIDAPQYAYTGEDYVISVQNADSWEFMIKRIPDDTAAALFQSAGSIHSSHPCIWDGNGIAPGGYYGLLALKNSYGRRLETMFQFTVLPEVGAVGPVCPREFDAETWIGDSADVSLSVYPNPSNAIFDIETNGDSIMSLRVYNVRGMMCYFDDNIGRPMYRLRLEAFPEGNYVVQVLGRKKVYTSKIIVKP